MAFGGGQSLWPVAVACALCGPAAHISKLRAPGHPIPNPNTHCYGCGAQCDTKANWAAHVNAICFGDLLLGSFGRSEFPVR